MPSDFIKSITMHCYTQNIKDLGLVVSEKMSSWKLIVFPIYKLMADNDAPREEHVWTPWAWLGFIL